MIKTNLSNAGIVFAKRAKDFQPVVDGHHAAIVNRTGAGSAFLGWTDWPEKMPPDLVPAITAKVAELKAKGVEYLLVIGIGGSYLGARAAIEMVNGLHPPNGTKVLYAGNTLSPAYLAQLVNFLTGKSFAINIVSKSGGTLEPAASFRLFRALLEKQVGTAEAAARIVATTDVKKGVLAGMARKHNYAVFDLPGSIGGRFSVLTPVGLLPMAWAQIDLQEVVAGARQANIDTQSPDLARNEAYKYAMGRFIMYAVAKQSAEMLVFYEPQLQSLGEWWKQLFGESEGKEHKALLPTSATFTTDLHSLGQFLQSGSRVVCETVVKINKPTGTLAVPPSAHENDDGLDYLVNRRFAEINEIALEGTVLAHAIEGAVPNIVLELEELSARAFGYFVQFMFRAAAMSAYMLGVNPFDQPGVEVYKKNIQARLKPE